MSVGLTRENIGWLFSACKDKMCQISILICALKKKKCFFYSNVPVLNFDVNLQ